MQHFSSTRTASVMACVLALALTGCMGSSRSRPAPVVAAPSAPVQTAELPPPPEPEAPISDDALPDPAAALPSDAQAVEIGRTDMLGGWTLAANGDTCGLFMSLTTWTGGYRASTRGCTDPTLASISAWEVAGNTVTLKGGDAAATVASVRATTPTTFSGTTAQGSAVSVTR